MMLLLILLLSLGQWNKLEVTHTHTQISAMEQYLGHCLQAGGIIKSQNTIILHRAESVACELGGGEPKVLALYPPRAWVQGYKHIHISTVKQLLGSLSNEKQLARQCIW